MRYSIPVKFLAILLTAVALLAGVASAFGIVQVAELGLYTDGFDSWVNNRLQWQTQSLAEKLTERYAVKKLTNCEDELLEELGYFYVFEDSVHWTGFSEDSYRFELWDASRNLLTTGGSLQEGSETVSYETTLNIQFPVLVTTKALIEEIYGPDYAYRKTVYPELYDNKPVEIRYYESAPYIVSITMDAGTVVARTGTSLTLVEMIYEMRYTLMILLASSMIVFAAGTVYLCCAAGKGKTGDTAYPGGLNRVPLDIYGAAGGVGGYFLFRWAMQLINYWVFAVDRLNAGTLAIVGTVLLGVALLIVGFLFALSAQVKSMYWWEHMLLGRLCRVAWKGIGYVREAVSLLVGLLPTVWHYLLAGALLGGLLILAGALFLKASLIWLFILILLVYLGVVLYGGFAYGMILQGAEKMAKGNLDSKVDTRWLIGSYGKCAEHLNALADVAIVAANKQMRSERMKTELITNVSHDIKTPLTSIINYVDILQNARNKQETDQYLEVLGRQSQRLKKLIEDLMEMSKAATGNMTVDIAQLDAGETVTQALGEFSDKLADKKLSVVFRQPEHPVRMHADGRLTWRVLSNLLSNIVKYAMPGTRVYADVTELENKVLISLKNISREPLNITAEELTERFVRGDAARNTEGSGLGLNIAKSLMELQTGQLKLLVDGDLFKATLVFPKA